MINASFFAMVNYVVFINFLQEIIHLAFSLQCDVYVIVLILGHVLVHDAVKFPLAISHIFNESEQFYKFSFHITIN